MTQSSPSRTARVLSEARSEPASGSENPWHHQMSRFAVAGRNFSFCSCEPKAAMTGTDHVGVETPKRFGNRRKLQFVEPDVVLDRGPVLAAPLDRPVRYRQTVSVEDLLRLDHTVAPQLLAVGVRLPDVRGDLRTEETSASRRGTLVPRRSMPGSSGFLRTRNRIHVRFDRTPTTMEAEQVPQKTALRADLLHGFQDQQVTPARGVDARFDIQRGSQTRQPIDQPIRRFLRVVLAGAASDGDAATLSLELLHDPDDRGGIHDEQPI